ncbi:AAA family ATPase [Vibrio sp. Makdt]|uniref:AAA family ATPase n=1 Tax=Vibrio sp. Makdt TaxID=2998828 RepID=UPI0022CDA38E|nr:AAA family ATPase [Vibrio sp. Makdt]MDA0151583.1 AAA family ATPase [Vibrio sp. Makdt]
MSKTRKLEATLRVTSIVSETDSDFVFRAVAIDSCGTALDVNEYYVVQASPLLVPIQPTIGQHWHVVGDASSRKVLRNGFKTNEVNLFAHKLTVLLPESNNSFVNFIKGDSEFSHVGPVTAKKLWETFQSEVYQILSDGDIDKLTSVKGISKVTADGLVKGWNKYENLKNLWWFEKHKIPSGIAMDLIKFHGVESLQRIQEDPYRLISFGLSFKDTDQIALHSFGLQTNSQERLIGAIEFAQHQRMKQGHTVSSFEELAPLVNRCLNDINLSNSALKQSYETPAFTIDKQGDFHPAGLIIMEQTIALRLAKLTIKCTWSHHYDNALATTISELPYSLTNKQKEAVITSLKMGTSIITGGAGTGKTTVLSVIMNAYVNLNVQVIPMALSGRATKRITEATGFKARTIAGFIHNVKQYDLDRPTVLIIDEASMLDLCTMYNLVRRTPPNVRFILVGDSKQLPPIGTGLVFHDAVNIIPTTALDVIKRQDESTGIPLFTEQVSNGSTPDAHLFNDNIRFHQVKADGVLSKVAELYATSPSNTQIVTAQNNALSGVIQINTLCQAMFNPNGKRLDFFLGSQKHHLKINDGDPIVFNDNHWDKDIQNGTMGHLINVGQSSSSTQNIIALADVELDDGRTIPLTHDLLDSIRPAYAITLHKAQGSQFNRVIIPISNSSLIDRSWIYTALTRAEVSIELVGDFSDFKRGICRQGSAGMRKTYLRELLNEELIAMHEATL